MRRKVISCSPHRKDKKWNINNPSLVGRYFYQVGTTPTGRVKGFLYNRNGTLNNTEVTFLPSEVR